jgi:hypothetical protein
VNPDGTVAGTGLTPAELSAAGYSDSEIQGLLSANDTSTLGIATNFVGPLPPTPAPSSSAGSWLSAIGTTFTNVFRAINPPTPGTRLINPATGLPYTAAQLAGTGVSGIGNILPLLIVIGLIWAFTRK